MKRIACTVIVLVASSLACSLGQQVQDALIATYVAQTAQAAAIVTPEASPTPYFTATPPLPGAAFNFPEGTSNLACFLTDGGVTCLADSGWFDPLESNPILDGEDIEDIAVCPNGTLLFSYSGGVSAYGEGQWLDYPSGDYWSWPSVACDANGTIWVAHSEGLSRYDATGWTNLPNTGLEDNIGFVKGIAASLDGTIWVETDDSIYRFDGQGWQTFTTGQGWTENLYFNGLVINSAGAAVATASDRLLVFYGGEWNSLPGPSEQDIEAVYLDTSDTIWVGTEEGFAQFNQDPTQIGAYDAFPQSPKNPTWILWDIPSMVVSSRNVQSLAADELGRMWLGTEWGLLAFDGANWAVYHMHTADLSGNRIEDMVVVGAGPALPSLIEKAPGGLQGRLLKNGAPLANANIELCVESLGLFYSGETPCSGQPFTRATTTGADGSFFFDGLPPGRYVLTFQEPGEGWTRLTSFLADRWFLVEPGQVASIGDIDIGEE